MTAADFAERIDRARKSGRNYIGCCPAHEDAHESLSFRDAERGLLVKCHAGCSVSAIAAARGLRVADLFHDSATNGAGPRARIVATYDYVDERGELLYQVMRFDPKGFRQRRPDGRGGWAWNLDGVRRALYRLPDLAEARTVYVVEGERDADNLAALGLIATTNAGGAGKWGDGLTRALVDARVEHVVILPDADAAGERHALDVGRACLAAGLAVKVVRLPGLPAKGDVSDYLAAGHSRAELEALVAAAPEVGAADVAEIDAPPPPDAGPWSRARSAAELLAEPAADAVWIDYPFCLRGAITEINAPRGTGKSIVLLARMVALARRGVRVLYLDRDNAPATLRKRLAGLGAHDVTTFRALHRAQAPRLEDVAAWAAFPIADYDVVCLDSWDTFAEGAGEQDSRRTTLAQAPLLDVARNQSAPGVVVLGNVTKDGARGRGSGVREDRADIVYEARDITGFSPSGRRAWWEEMPAAGRDGWAERATRRTTRKDRGSIRLALISTKTRDDEDPAPVAFEVDFTTEPWSVRDVTAELAAAGDAAKAAVLAREAALREQAAAALVAEITRRAEAGEPALLTKPAIALLTAAGLALHPARALLRERAGSAWRLDPRDGRSIAVVAIVSDEQRAISGAVTTQSRPPEIPRKQRGFEPADWVGRINTGRPDHPAQETAKTLKKPGRMEIGSDHFYTDPPRDIWGVSDVAEELL